MRIRPCSGIEVAAAAVCGEIAVGVAAGVSCCSVCRLRQVGWSMATAAEVASRGCGAVTVVGFAAA